MVERRNIGFLLKLTTEEKAKLEAKRKDEGFPDANAYIRYRLFYSNPFFEVGFISKMEKFLLNKEYRKATRFLESIKKKPRKVI